MYKEHHGTSAHREKVRSNYIDDIRAFYKQLTQYYHSCLTETTRAWLHRRGFTDSTIEQRMIGYCPDEHNPIYQQTIAVESGMGLPHNNTPIMANRVTFPYFFDDSTIIDIRGRTIDPDEEMRYRSPYRSSFYRGADYCYNHQMKQPIIITEGEIKADIATQFGYPAISLPGINSRRKLPFTERLIIIFDSQIKNQRFVNEAIDKLARDIIDPYVATLPLFGKEKQGLDDFLLEYGTDIFDSVINGALPYQEWKALQRY